MKSAKKSSTLPASNQSGKTWHALTVLLMGLALTACNKADESQTTGQKIDSTVAKTEKAVTELKREGEKSGADLKAKTEESLAKAVDALKNATEKSEATAKIITAKTINKIDDMAISTAVSAELLKDPEIKFLKINVDTKNGAVVLNGTVPTGAAKARAESIAKTFDGVQSVDNRLVIKVN